MRLFLIASLLSFCYGLPAQVEVFRGDVDTAKYINPKDTITIAPKFENGDMDFYRYIETHMNMLKISNSLTYAGANFKFSFYIEKNGELSNLEMISFGDAIISSELERVLNLMPNWTPGIYQGKKKKILMIYDINIKRVNDFSSIQVTPRDTDIHYTRETNQIKWAIVVGSVLILLSFIITRA